MSDLSTLCYYVEIDKYLFEDELKFEGSGEKIKGIKLRISRESKPLYALFIEFSLSDVTSLEEAEQTVQQSLNDIVIELTVRYKIYAGNIYLTSYNITNQGESILISNIAIRQWKDDILKKEDKDELIRILNESIEKSSEYVENTAKNLFRIAMSNRDITAKYMLLYLILLFLTKDSEGKEKQGYVDNYINDDIGEVNSEYSDGPQQKRNGTYIKETIYTKLRNEIGHFRDIDLAETRKEMERTINSLVDIVRKAVLLE
ncbi:hypothetical protein [Paenibacillus sp. B2(2019)]|uniref:hypothetical protein n=1 Tax=Paenibacillus sp. B2(2019) TaxID=2607754 RepID=UPI0011F142B4|nr:hypothetical protein [Paenibacillus sp. B2(2019)]KAA1180897.1 hypothetical protein PAENI_27060 [Paenibacillus sp. B2(2019)]